MSQRLLVVFLLLPFVLFAADPVGKVTAVASFELSGTRVPVAGVPHWPVVMGDVVEFAGSTGLLDLRDGSRLWFGPQSKFSIERIGGQTMVLLGAGTLWYERPADSQLVIAAESREPVSQSLHRGSLSFSGEAASSELGGGKVLREISVLKGKKGGGAPGPPPLVPPPGAGPPHPPPGKPGVGPPFDPPPVSPWKPGTKPPHAPGPPGGTPPGLAGRQ